MQVPLKPINIDDIPPVGSDYYENIFNVYQTEDDSKYYYFNINSKITFDTDNIDEQYIEYVFIDRPMPLTTISYRLFGSMHLWWLIVLMNKLDPIQVPPAGSVLMVPRRFYLQNILNAIRTR